MKQVVSRLVCLLSCAAFISSCDVNGNPSLSEAKKIDPIDRDKNLTREDFEKMRDLDSVKKPAEVNANLSNVVEPPIPDLAEILAAPPKPKLGQTQLVSIAVTDDVPLKDVLLEVARLAKVDIDVDASITGGISMRATDKPFNEVIDRIADMAGLRYNMKNGVLRIERDTPYIKVYSLDLLNIDRNSQSSISSGSSSTGSSSSSGSSSGGSSSGSSSGGSGGTGSSSSITYKADSDFWVKFESSIGQILAFSPSQRTSATTVAAQPVPPAANATNPGSSPADSKHSEVTQEKAAIDLKSTTKAASPVNLEKMQAASASPASSASSAAPTIPAANSGVFYILNRQAGTLTVSATEKQHETVKKFIDTISQNASAQVLIEAKIVEVNLNDTYQTGIDWTRLGNKNVTANLNPVAAVGVNGVKVPTSPQANINILSSGLDLSATVKMLDEFGTTRGISSPRLHAINNQQAVLSFVQNYTYFKIELKTTDAVVDATTHQVTTPAKVDVTTTPISTPIGILLNLQPSIDRETSEVTLSIRPTITKFLENIIDPGFEVSKATAIAAMSASLNGVTNTDVADAIKDSITKIKDTQSNYPKIETRELDSIVKIKSGQTLVIGGLLEDKIENVDAGVPYASEIPIFGNLFKSVTKTNSKKELVIFIRATIVGSNGNADPYDKGLYEKFIDDPRPLKF